VPLPSVKTTYTERRSLDGENIQEPRNPGEAEEPVPGFSVGVPVADRKALPGGRVQPQTSGRAVWDQHPFEPALGESVPASRSGGA
jgi:hypothetical protein